MEVYFILISLALWLKVTEWDVFITYTALISVQLLSIHKVIPAFCFQSNNDNSSETVPQQEPSEGDKESGVGNDENFQTKGTS